jgi:hypothetical protein
MVEPRRGKGGGCSLPWRLLTPRCLCQGVSGRAQAGSPGHGGGDGGRRRTGKKLRGRRELFHRSPQYFTHNPLNRIAITKLATSSPPLH